MVSKSQVVAPVLAVMMLCTCGLVANAAPASVDRSPSKLADADPIRPVAATDGEEEAASCSKSRKRLWIEGEGWVVRKVTTCR